MKNDLLRMRSRVLPVACTNLRTRNGDVRKSGVPTCSEIAAPARAATGEATSCRRLPHEATWIHGASEETGKRTGLGKCPEAKTIVIASTSGGFPMTNLSLFAQTLGKVLWMTGIGPAVIFVCALQWAERWARCFAPRNVSRKFFTRLDCSTWRRPHALDDMTILKGTIPLTPFGGEKAGGDGIRQDRDALRAR